MKRLFLPVLLLLIGIHSFAYAADEGAVDEEAFQFAPIVVEAARSESDYKKLPSSIEVITSEALEVKPDTGSFYRALKNSVGVHTDEGSGMGWSEMTIRGERPTVLFNGMNINPYISFFPFNILTAGTGAVERIEILKGAQAATYGSGATSGAVNVVMKKGDAKNPYAKMRLGGGSHDAMDGEFTVSGGKDRYSWFFDYTQSYMDDYKTPHGKIPYTDSRFRNFFGRLDFAGDDKQELSLETMYADGRYRTGGKGYYYVEDGQNDRIWENSPETLGVFLKYKRDFDRFGIQAKAGYLKNDLEYVYGGPSYDVPSFLAETDRARMNEDTYMIDLKSQIKIIEDDLLTAHLNYNHATTEAKSVAIGGWAPFDYDSTIHLDGFVGQLESKPIPYVLLTAGVRQDMYRRDGDNVNNTSPNVGASIYPFAKTDYDWTTIWASYSEAFRMPPANYLYMPAALGGNPDLKPEKSKSWEGGIKQNISRWASFEATYFQRDYEDRIVFDLTAFKLLNIAKTRTKGFEAQISVYPLEYLTLYANYMKMKRTDRETGDRLYASPTPDEKLVFGVAVDKLYGFKFGFEAAYYMDYKFTNSVYETEKHPNEDKLVMDARLSYLYRIKDSLSLEPYIQLTNITDQLVYTAGDTFGIRPGRTFNVGMLLTYNF